MKESVLQNLINFCRQISKQKLVNATSTRYNEIVDEYGLILEGETLSVILDEDILTKEFLTLASCCNSVVCCRSTPTQKVHFRHYNSFNFSFLGCYSINCQRSFTR